MTHFFHPLDLTVDRGYTVHKGSVYGLLLWCSPKANGNRRHQGRFKAISPETFTTTWQAVRIGESRNNRGSKGKVNSPSRGPVWRKWQRYAFGIEKTSILNCIAQYNVVLCRKWTRCFVIVLLKLGPCRSALWNFSQKFGSFKHNFSVKSWNLSLMKYVSSSFAK